jgi:hypothetical protein
LAAIEACGVDPARDTAGIAATEAAECFKNFLRERLKFACFIIHSKFAVSGRENSFLNNVSPKGDYPQPSGISTLITPLPGPGSLWENVAG